MLMLSLNILEEFMNLVFRSMLTRWNVSVRPRHRQCRRPTCFVLLGSVGICKLFNI